MKIEELLKQITPPILTDLGVALVRPMIGFWGRYPNWQDASRHCRGYETTRIIASYKNHLVSRLESDCEHQFQSNRKIRILAALGLVEAKKTKKLITVLDYGGGWGGDFFELSGFISQLSQWTVVESSAIAQALRETPALPGRLRFQSDSEFNSSQQDQIDVILASGVLQYLEHGLLHLETTFLNGEFLILDRVPLLPIRRSTVTIQRTSRILGGIGSSYPVWLFSRQEFLDCVQKHWKIELSWLVPEDAPSVHGKRRPYEGFLLRRT